MAGVGVTVTITSWQEAFGTPGVGGNLQWQLTALATDSGGGHVIGTEPLGFRVVNGAAVSPPELWANDSITPSGTGWKLSGIVDGQAVSATYVLTSAMAPSIDLSALTPASVSTPVSPVNAVELQGVGVSSATPVIGQSLVFNGTDWVPATPAASLAFALVFGR